MLIVRVLPSCCRKSGIRDVSKAEIHQLVHTLSYGDAISGEIFALQRCWRNCGLHSDIFAINIHPKFKGQAHAYTSLPPDFRGEVVLHYSLGSPLNALYERLQGASRTLVYHNLTPAHWFRGVNPRIVADIENGARELPKLCRLTKRLVADSHYNARELQALGFEAEVLELPVDPERWDVAPNPGIKALLAAAPGIQVVHVGRLAPNKRIEDIIRTFYFVRRYIDGQAKLWLVGIDIDTELYSFVLKRLVQQLELNEAVNFVGCLADSEVKALYQGAAVYLCMSEHEGYCLPLIEAMHFGLPVIAYAGSAVSDTVGGGGILVREKRYAEIAELIGEIARSPEFKNKLVQAGRERVEQLSFAGFEQRVREIWALA